MGGCYNQCNTRVEIKERFFEEIHNQLEKSSITNKSLDKGTPDNKKQKHHHHKYHSKSYSKVKECFSTKNDDEDFYSNFVKHCTGDTRADIIQDKSVLHITVYGGAATGKTTFGYEITRKKINDFYIPSLTNEIIRTSFFYKKQIRELVVSIPTIKNSSTIISADCYLVFFDYSNMESFFYATKFIESKLKKFSEPIFLIGNKCDGKRIVPFEKIDQFCKDNKIQFFQISSRYSFGILNLMSSVKEEVMPRKIESLAKNEEKKD